MSNKGVPSAGASFAINQEVRDKLVIDNLSDNEKFDFGCQLTHKFKIKEFGKKYLYLNLTDDDLIKLGFIEPKQVLSKTDKLWIRTKQISKVTWTLIVGVTIVLGGIAAWLAIRHDLNNKESIKVNSLLKDQPKQTDQNTLHIDSTKISKHEK